MADQQLLDALARIIQHSHQWEGALEDLNALESTDLDNSQRSAIGNAKGVAMTVMGEKKAGFNYFQNALHTDNSNLQAILNLELLEADGISGSPKGRGSGNNSHNSQQRTKVAILSFLFNWPSKGGGIVHTVELCDFLQRAGYQVQHIYVRYELEAIGIVTDPINFPSQAIILKKEQWNRPTIQRLFREAVDAFGPDYVIITDSWNMKPILAEAMRPYPYMMRLQAMECLCPLNNLRLLPAEGGFRQCPLNQLAMPQDCRKCIHKNGHTSGSLHQLERDLAGVDTPGYATILRETFQNAHSVYVVNQLTETMVEPYAQRVKTVTAGMDPARFPDPWPNDPAPRSDRPIKQILFAGVIHETTKGFHVLHEAGQRLWDKRQDFEILVTSDPLERFDAFTQSVGWQTQESLPQLMRSVDIVAVPAISQEALGRTAVEAMAAGRPVVASRLGGLPFTVPDGATGILAEPGDSVDLAEKLNRLLDDASLRQRLGEAGRRRFLEHYAWPVIIEKHYLPLLGDPIKQRPEVPR